MPDPVLIQGTARKLPFADGTFNCVVTSPPYFGLRSYADLPPEPWPAGAYAPVPGAAPMEIPAWEGCLGNEPTPALFCFHLLLVLREIRRVLRDDGIAWIVLGDSFYGDSPTRQQSSEAWSEVWDTSQTASRGGLRRSAAQ